jgi:PKHD-type hydroxylase
MDYLNYKKDKDVVTYAINDLSNTNIWNLIQKNINNNLKLESAKVGGEDEKDDEPTRKSEICWINDSNLSMELFNAINICNNENWSYDLDGCGAIQYGTYSDGGYYDWHLDTEGIVPCINGKYLARKLSITIWLSDPDEYEGGEFDIEIKGPRMDVRYDTLKLKKGSIVVFPSDKWHRVRPVTSGVRKSLVTWFRGPPFR